MRSFVMIGCAIAIFSGDIVAAGPLRRLHPTPAKPSDGVTVVPRSAGEAPASASLSTTPFTTTPASILSGRSPKARGGGASPIAVAGGATPASGGGGASPRVLPQPPRFDARAE